MDKTVILTFDDVPIVTAGAFLLQENILVSGHANGLVYLWKVKERTRERLYSCNGAIRSIACSAKKEFVIGSHAGDLVVVTLDGKATKIKTGSNSTRDRVWNCEWINENKFVMTSTYGEFALFARDDTGNWVKENIHGHSQSIFGLSISQDKAFLATGDYFGNILVRNLNEDHSIYEKLNVIGNVQGLSWFKDESLAAINRDGRVFFFDKNHQWKLVSDLQNSSGVGKTICITDDGGTAFAGTETEVIQFDRANLQSDSIDITGTVEIFCHKNDVYVLTCSRFVKFEKKPVDVKTELVRFKYFKIGVVGRTRVGKSTLCSQIVNNVPGDGISTQGKKVWTLDLGKSDNLDKKVMFYDYGGQETALSTFLPFLVDSDIVLILFSQIDKHSLDEALKVYDRLSEKVSGKTKFFLVQTYIDQPVMPEIDFRKIDSLIREGKIIDNLKVSALTGSGVPDLREALKREISWPNSRIMIQNMYSDAVLNLILSLQAKNTTFVPLDDFMKLYAEDNPWLLVSRKHIRFLLESYSNQGIVEYDDVLQLIVINDPEYNKLKSEVPIVVMQNDGIVLIDNLRRRFKDNKYFDALDAMYLRYKIAIENFEQRIFPELLKEEGIFIPDKFSEYFSGKATQTKFMTPHAVSTEGLIDAFSELKLRCIEASRNDGLFSWEENAMIYYCFENTRNALDGRYLKASYRIGGKNPLICERLEQVFLTIIDRQYGPFLNLQVDDKKKVDSSRKVTFDVAISFAAEQREYADKLNDELSSRGVNVFYDRDQDLEAVIWGKELAEYLADIYQNQSRFCIMLISNAYVSKAWPTFECKNAIARQIQQMGEYILPIRFDDSVVPGLLPTISYIRSTERNPSEASELIMKKLEASLT